MRNSVLIGKLTGTTIDVFFFFFNDTATTEIYTLSLHDALPISFAKPPMHGRSERARCCPTAKPAQARSRSEEHTSELQSPCNLVCRLLLEKKKTKVERSLPPPLRTHTQPTRSRS